jgi:hypothetical protein
LRIACINPSAHISKSADTLFEVTDQSGKVTLISYSDAQKVRGPGLSKGAKIGIVVGAAVAVTAIVIGRGLNRRGTKNRRRRSVFSKIFF